MGLEYGLLVQSCLSCDFFKKAIAYTVRRWKVLKIYSIFKSKSIFFLSRHYLPSRASDRDVLEKRIYFLNDYQLLCLAKRTLFSANIYIFIVLQIEKTVFALFLLG